MPAKLNKKQFEAERNRLESTIREIGERIRQRNEENDADLETIEELQEELAEVTARYKYA